MVTFAKKASQGTNIFYNNDYNEMLKRTVKYNLLILRRS